MQPKSKPDDNKSLAIAQSLLRDGNFNDALDIFRDLLLRHGDNPRLLHLAGTTALQAALDQEAVSWFDKSIALDAEQADTYCHLGIAYWNLRKFEQAEKAYRNAIRLNEEYPDAYNNLCLVLQDGFKQSDAALKMVERAIAIKPDFADAHNNRGNVLQALGRFADALESYERAIALKPDLASAFNNRGNALRKLDRIWDAINAYRKAIGLKPDYTEAYCNMGCALSDLGAIDEARDAYLRSVSLDSSFADAHYNLGSLESAVGNHALALSCFDKAIDLNPNFADGYWNKSLLKLLLGDYREGFSLYEWGWRNQIRGNRRLLKQPQWLGKEQIAGKRLLILQEQGIGDCIHYARYIKEAVAIGAHVIMEAVAPLIPLLKSTKVPCEFIPLGSSLPDFDYYIPLMSLPLAFDTTLETIPSREPYLFAEYKRVEAWYKTLGAKTRQRIGLVWSGSMLHKNDSNRSMGLKEFLPLLSLPFEFHCLQKEIRAEDALCLPALPMVRVYQDQILDFADTAALVAAMDVVISVDTSVAHLAAAMGKPTWVLLPVTPDWRWMLNREDSPWYPSVRLFRQTNKGDWSGVIDAVRAALERAFIAPELSHEN